jgi:glutathione S-transferase
MFINRWIKIASIRLITKKLEKKMKLHSACYYPFAQRAWMALEHKGIYFDDVAIDPYDKTSWWLEVSRGSAMVPVIAQSGIVEPSNSTEQSTGLDSNRILEYLDDLYPQQTPIFSDKSGQRAEQKYWTDHIGNKITPYFYRYLKANKTGTTQDEALAKMMAGLASFAEAMHSQGPFFNGHEVGVVDISMIPFSYQIKVLLEHHLDFKLPTEGDSWTRYHRWYNAMLESSAIRTTATDHVKYRASLVEFYLPYSVGGGQSDVKSLRSVA